MDGDPRRGETRLGDGEGEDRLRWERRGDEVGARGSESGEERGGPGQEWRRGNDVCMRVT